MRRYGLLAIILLATACSLVEQAPPRQPAPVPAPEPGSAPGVPEKMPVPVPPEQPEPRARAPMKEYKLSLASQSLINQARTQTAKGDFPVAAASVERALRIEPDNPLLWIELGKVRQASGNFAQAEHTGRKALSLATGDLKAQVAAWQLIAKSLRARGKNDQALAADARAAALTPD